MFNQALLLVLLFILSQGNSLFTAAQTFECNGYHFQLKLPEGYQLQTQEGPLNMKAMAWVGPPREDGVRPYVMITVMSLPAPPEGQEQIKAEAVLEKFLTGIKNRRQDWKQSPARKQEINGLTFLRADWEGIETKSELKMHGFNLATIDRQFVVQLSSQDVEPHHTKGLQLAEASIATFKSVQEKK